MASALERKGTFKVEYLQRIEQDVQNRWNKEKIYEEDAPASPRKSRDEKFFTTFPFPYMNGRLHMGHTFSLSKCEFATRYQRLKGKRVLFPFGFHCTGMPIKACADKLKREMETFGFPPKFPSEEPEKADETETNDEIVIKDKSKGKKSKAVAKAGGAKYQWQIMQSLGLADDDIKLFANASHWLDHFPPLAVQDLTSIGLHVDWRRTFITTDANPFFDSFVRWQFLKLRDKSKIKYGKRYTVFSPRDNQPCMDHDRATGEGVGPQEYTLIKMRLLQPYPDKLQQVEGEPVFLVAGTLRPETMYGQTNCWVRPDLQYAVFRNTNREVFVCTERSARNMSYQGFTAEDGKLQILFYVTGQDIMGCGLRAPNSPHPIIYTLPMLSIKEDKGTGVVTSVPSDSPDDYAALTDLKKKPAFREKYHVTDEMVLPFEPIAIIDVPDFGNLCAVTVYEKLKIQSQNDKDKLQEAKELVYLKSFYDGVMTVGEYKGKKVQDVKKLLQKELVDRKEAMIYYEPEKKIVSRSGEECVVALCDQWYLDYGEDAWKAKATKCLEGMSTKLPWDEQWLIESLSDSTIYNAYYTVAHLLQGGSFKGEKGNQFNIKAEELTPEVWDYIFIPGAPFPKSTKIKRESLDLMRREFLYWYPVDLRCSGKDLIQNHLTFFIYNHCAIWEQNEEMWPRGVRANGHLLLNSAKMSKSEGNFLTLSEAVHKFSADGMRLCLADSGDSVEDANFVESMADAGILRLYTFIEWVKEMMSLEKSLRTGPSDSFNDLVFQSEMNLKVRETDENYNKMLFKEALRTGFFEMQAVRDKYRELCQVSGGMHRDLVLRFIELQALLLSPICPHVAEHVYSLIGKSGSIVRAAWPAAGEVDEVLVQSSVYLTEAAHSFRLQLKNHLSAGKKSKTAKVVTQERPSHATAWVAKTYPPWQSIVLTTMRQMHQANNNSYPGNKEISVALSAKLKKYMKRVMPFEQAVREKANNNSFPDNKEISVALSAKPELKKYMKRVMPFVQAVREKVTNSGLTALNLTLDFDEIQILNSNKAYLENTLELEELEIAPSTSEGAPDHVREDCCPGAPYITFRAPPPGLSLTLINPQPLSGHITHWLTVRSGDTVSKLATALARADNTIKDARKVELWRWEDPELGPRKMPNCNTPLQGRVLMSNSDVLIVDLESRTVSVQNNGKQIQLGESVTYVVTHS